MISDPVERWKKRLGKGTWDTYSQWWDRFLEVMEIDDPAKLLELSPRELSDLAIEYYDILKNQRYSSKSCSLAYSTVRSFLGHNGIRLEKYASKFDGHTQYERGYVCTQQEVFQLVEAVPLWRNKFIVGLCFQGGQRDGICTGLKFQHIDTRSWREGDVVTFTIPKFLPNHRGRNVNKRNVKYSFGVLDDVARYLVLHVKARERLGEEITSDSWLIRGRTHGHPPNTNRIGDIVKDAAEKIGIQKYTETARGRRKALIHPHVGRIYFKTQMRKSNVDPDLRKFMMGHKMPFEGAYDRFVGEVAPAMERARSRLALIPESVSRLDQRKQNVLDSVRAVLPKEQLEWLEARLAYATTDEEFDAVLDNFKNGRTELQRVRR